MTSKRRSAARARAVAAGPRLEPFLAVAIQGGLLLLALMPLVVTSSTHYPFVVGKALYARSLIEVLFGLWVLLALLAPAYRPRRSVVLVLVGAGLAWTVVTGLLGVSPLRSLWSTYERMRGIVDTAHWAALTLVVACVLRTARQWTVLLNMHIAVSAGVALLAVLQVFGGLAVVPLIGEWLEPGMQRPYGTLGNAIYLGAYLVLSAILAVGLLVRSLVPEEAPAPDLGGERPPAVARARRGRWLAFGAAGAQVRWRVFWSGCAALDLWGAALAASMGPWLGLLLGIAALATVCLFLARGRRGRWAGIGALCVIAALGTAPLLLAPVVPEAVVESAPTAVRRALEVNVERKSLQSRLAAWRAGMAGLADRPLAGWGAENFLNVFGRYGDALPEYVVEHDLAHNEVVEELTAKGWPGGGLYLGLWLATVLALVRAARRTAGRERVLTLTVGCALAAHFGCTLTLFPVGVGWMQYALLLGFVVGLEMRAQPARPAWRVPGGLRLAAVTAIGCVVVAGLWTSYAIFGSAVALSRAGAFAAASRQALERSRAEALFTEALGWYGEAVGGVGPLANDARLSLFVDCVLFLRGQPPHTRRLPAWLDAQVAAAVALEPDNWVLRLELAHLYAEAAEATGGRPTAARRHVEALSVLAPHERGVLSLFGRPLRPRAVWAAVRPDGLLLGWQRGEGVLTHRVQERTGPGDWETVYDGVASRAVVAARGTGRRAFRVRACRGPGACGRWSRTLRVVARGPTER